MGEARSQFTFYASYWEAMKVLKPAQRAAAFDAIIQYALFETPPSLKDPIVNLVFTLVKPTLDKGRAKALSGKKGGSAPASDGSASPNGESKPQANGKQTAREKEIEREVEREREIEIELEIDNISNNPNHQDNKPTPSVNGTVSSLPPDESYNPDLEFAAFWQSWGVISHDGEEDARAAWMDCIKSKSDAEKAKFRIGPYWCSLMDKTARRVPAAEWIRKGAWQR